MLHYDDGDADPGIQSDDQTRTLKIEEWSSIGTRNSDAVIMTAPARQIPDNHNWLDSWRSVVKPLLRPARHAETSPG